MGEKDGGAGKYLIGTVVKACRVEDWLASGDIQEWRTAQETAQATAVTRNEAYRILETLAAAGRVEKGDKGWRINPTGIIRHAFYVHEYLAGVSGRFLPPGAK